MNLLLDTNIILNITRSKDIDGIVDFLNPENSPLYISVVSEAEIKSIALRKKWGTSRLDFLNGFLESCHIVDVDQLFVNIYIEIDAYSQRSNPNFESYPFRTPRNMGKNDLWIASLAALLNLKLVTTDSDFDHLDKVFFEVMKVSQADFTPFF
jgi:tRNA(fMet)-specific endonuclease VapC